MKTGRPRDLTRSNHKVGEHQVAKNAINSAASFAVTDWRDDARLFKLRRTKRRNISTTNQGCMHWPCIRHDKTDHNPKCIEDDSFVSPTFFVAQSVLFVTVRLEPVR